MPYAERITLELTKWEREDLGNHGEIKCMTKPKSYQEGVELRALCPLGPENCSHSYFNHKFQNLFLFSVNGP